MANKITSTFKRGDMWVYSVEIDEYDRADFFSRTSKTQTEIDTACADWKLQRDDVLEREAKRQEAEKDMYLTLEERQLRGY